MFAYIEREQTEKTLREYFNAHKKTKAINFFGRIEKVPNVLKERFIETLRITDAFGIRVNPDGENFSEVLYFACDEIGVAEPFKRTNELDKIMFPYFSEYGYYQSAIKYMPDGEAVEQIEPPAELFQRYIYFCFDNKEREQILNVLQELISFSPEKIENIEGMESSYFTLTDTFYPWAKYKNNKNILADKCFTALRDSDTPFIEITEKQGIISSRNMICERGATLFHQTYRLDLRRKFRSSWEANVARILNKLNVPYEYERESYQIGEDFYLPDFFLTNSVILEVKGFWDSESRKKIAALQKEYPEFRVLPVDSDMYGTLQEKFSTIIPEWEESRIHKMTTEEVAIVGMKFCADKITISNLCKGDSLIFKREPDNQFDRNAILALTVAEKPIGHLSGDWAAVYAPKIDCGMEYAATIIDIQPKVITVKMWRTNPEKEALYECFL